MTEKWASKTVQIALPGKPVAKIMKACEAMAFASQLAEAQQWSVTIVLMKQVIDQVPQYQCAWDVLLNAQRAMEDYVALSHTASKCLKLHSESVLAMGCLAWSLTQVGRYDEALQILLVAIDVEPHNTDIQAQLTAVGAALETD